MANKYSKHTAGTFEMKDWEEKTWDGKDWSEVSGAKLTHVKVTQSFQGDIHGEGPVQFLMVYRDDGSVIFVGLEQVAGQVGGRSGSFVLQCSGTFEGDTAKTTWVVVPGSGTGELRGLRGEGGYVARHGEQQISFTLDYDFE
jgi:hypothetical protein